MVFLRRLSQGFFLFTYILWPAAFRINPLIIFITFISKKVIPPGIILSILMILLTLIFGRFFCGWICPLGTSIDIVGAIRKKKIPLSDAANRKLRLPKFFILGVITVFAFIGIPIVWIFDPMIIMARFISLNLSAIIILLFLVIAGSAVLLSRCWCRSICPLGAIYALVAKFALLRRTTEGCIHCQRCKSNCRTGAIKDDSSYIKGECILCMDCIYDCQEHITKFTWPFSNRTKVFT